MKLLAVVFGIGLLSSSGPLAADTEKPIPHCLEINGHQYCRVERTAKLPPHHPLNPATVERVGPLPSLICVIDPSACGDGDKWAYRSGDDVESMRILRNYHRELGDDNCTRRTGRVRDNGFVAGPVVGFNAYKDVVRLPHQFPLLGRGVKVPRLSELFAAERECP